MMRVEKVDEKRLKRHIEKIGPVLDAIESMELGFLENGDSDLRLPYATQSDLYQRQWKLRDNR